jgi:hypothetical protein
MEFLLFVIFTAWLGLLTIAQLDLAPSLAKPKPLLARLGPAVHW